MNTKGLLALVLAVLVVGVAFYWYEYKPRQIREACSADAHFDARASSEMDDVKRQAFINRYYDDCLMRFGLK